MCIKEKGHVSLNFENNNNIIIQIPTIKPPIIPQLKH